MPEVLNVYFLAGRDDFHVHVAAQDPDDLRAFVVDHLSSAPEVALTETNLIFEHKRGRLAEYAPSEPADPRGRRGQPATRRRHREQDGVAPGAVATDAVLAEDAFADAADARDRRLRVRSLKMSTCQTTRAQSRSSKAWRSSRSLASVLTPVRQKRRPSQVDPMRRCARWVDVVVRREARDLARRLVDLHPGDRAGPGQVEPDERLGLLDRGRPGERLPGEHLVVVRCAEDTLGVARVRAVRGVRACRPGSVPRSSRQGSRSYRQPIEPYQCR